MLGVNSREARTRDREVEFSPRGECVLHINNAMPGAITGMEDTDTHAPAPRRAATEVEWPPPPPEPAPPPGPRATMFRAISESQLR